MMVSFGGSIDGGDGQIWGGIDGVERRENREK